MTAGTVSRMIVTVCLWGMLPLWAAHLTYYVDATGGNDGSAGASPAAAWKNLSKVNGTTFGPGDTILLKAGSVWTGSLSPQGSGASGSPNVIDTFGAGAKPIINANGAVANTFSLSNQQYWEVNNLELTNDDNFSVEDNSASRNGMMISGGTVNHIYIRNCYIHDVDGNADGGKATGGIMTSASKFNDLRIENNTVRKVDRTGIVTWGATAAHTNVVIRGNTIVSTGGDAMIVLGCMKALVEYNLADGCCARCTGCNAGIWPFASDSTLLQFNEACNTMGGGCDRTGFDSDWKCRGTVFQYNYSHDNAGGFMLICSPGKTTPEYASQGAAGVHNYGTVVRYNISQNDRSTVIDPKGEETKDTKIYNNTIYLGKGVGNTFIINDGDWGGKAGTTFIYNNIFYALASNINPFGVNPNYTYSNNCYYLPNTIQPDTTRHKNAVFSDPLFEDPGKGAMGLQSVIGYKLKANSPCINKGIDMRTKGENPGTRDYFGNAIPAASAFDIGASEFQGPFGPICLITSPADWRIFASGTTPITISAQASHPENRAIAGIAFYQGTTKIGDGVNGPAGWSYAWNNVADGVYTLTAVVTDAQGATATSSPLHISVGYRNPENPANVNPGIAYSYYEGTWTQIPDYSAMAPVANGTLSYFSLAVAKIADHFGIRFTGYIDVPADGVYTFFTNSDDGTNLYIGNTLLVNNDGSHGPTEAFGIIGLKAGKHALTVDYMEDWGGQSLSVSWQCATASIAKQTVPASRLYQAGPGVAVKQAIPRNNAIFDLRVVHTAGSSPVVQYSLPEGLSKRNLTIRLVDYRGSLLRTLFSGAAASGSHSLKIPDILAPGRYLCVMSAGGFEKAVAVEMMTPFVVVR